jgi:hypothetical protein
VIKGKFLLPLFMPESGPTKLTVAKDGSRSYNCFVVIAAIWGKDVQIFGISLIFCGLAVEKLLF